MAIIVRRASFSRLALAALFWVATSAHGAVSTTDDRSPHPVSPGDRAAGAVTEARCPTFQWSGVSGAKGYELAVFRAEAGTEPVLVARASVPGDGVSVSEGGGMGRVTASTGCCSGGVATGCSGL